MFVPADKPSQKVLTAAKLAFTSVATAGVPLINELGIVKVAIIL
jgi:hypothetical protein